MAFFHFFEGYDAFDTVGQDVLGCEVEGEPDEAVQGGGDDETSAGDADVGKVEHDGPQGDEPGAVGEACAAGQGNHEGDDGDVSVDGQAHVAEVGIEPVDYVGEGKQEQEEG